MIVKYSYLQHILMFVDGYTELVFPAIRIEGGTGGTILSTFTATVCFSAIQIKYKEQIGFCPDKFPEDLVPVFRIPVHQRHDFSRKNSASNSLWLS